ncbi:MAG TPA: permease prefix domain 1-containing protein [Actinocatenispora sp.]
MPTDTIDGHLSALAAALPGPSRARTSLLGEARDGLVDAATAYRAAGYPPERAEELAVADFGTVGELAAEYRAELALSQGRRTLLVTLAVQVGVWLLSELSWRLNQDQMWGTAQPSGAYRLLARAVDAAQLVPAVCAALAVAVAFTYGQRFLTRPDLLARVSGVFGLGVAGLMLVSCVVMSAATPGLRSVEAVAVSLGMAAVPAALIALSARRSLVAAHAWV